MFCQGLADNENSSLFKVILWLIIILNIECVFQFNNDFYILTNNENN